MTKVGLVKTILAATALVLSILPVRGHAQLQQEGLLVVYGVQSPTREGDVDRREQIFFSVPADLSDRLYVRVFDPEVFGDNDFTYGGPAGASTVFRIFGGAGAFSEADRPEPVEDGARAPARVSRLPVTGPGNLLEERDWGSDRATNGRWATLGVVRARQGEVIEGRAYFRLDIQGAGGNDGNGYSVNVSLSRDRDRAPDGLEMFAYRPTVRWSRDHPATQVWFNPPGDGPFTVQSFDAANGEIALVTDYEDLGVRVSGQDFWTSDTVDTDETNLALSLLGGFETPNDVTLAVFDGTGRPMPLQIPPARALIPARPTAVGTARPLADCRAVAFDGSRSLGRDPLSYEWDFGDGQSSTDRVIAYRYTDPGRYTARLRVLEEGSRPGRGDQIDLPVHVRFAPVAVPGAKITVAPGEIVDFDGSASQPSDSPITGYRWTFGDGAVAEGMTAQHVYSAPGLYRAVLRVRDDSQHPCFFGVATREVTVNFPPVGEAGTDQSAIVGQAVALSAAASYDVDGLIDTYRWDMGDGTILEGANVSHSFQNSGVYRVMLSVVDDSGVSNDTARDWMQVAVNSPPKPVIQIPPRPVSVSEAAILDGSLTTDDDGQILSYLWDFGDGAIGEGPIVNYAWTQPGVYRVVLTVTDDSGTASAQQTTAMDIVIDDAPVADAGPDQFVTASDVTFNGAGSSDSDGTITSYEWDFGDGNFGTGQEVTHAYARSGVYEVALIVRDDSGAPLNWNRDTTVLTINTVPIADAGPPQTVAPGEEFILSGRASVDPDGSISDYLWTYPDGSTARGERAAYKIDEPGLHRIRLTVFDDFRGGSAQDDSEVLITVNAPPVAIAGADQLIAPGETLTFDAGQSFDPDGNLVSYRWEFDDLGAPLEALTIDRAYTSAGVWSAQLIVTDDSGVLNATATDDIIVRVNHAPIAEAGPSINTDRLIVDLDASASSDADGDALIYRWDFGDGTAPAFGQKVRHVYPRSGIYPVTLRVDDGTGLANARAIDATVVEINARPVADAGGNRDVCSGQPILFDASASVDPDGGLLLYSWDFGDGSSSDLINPTKTYELPGTYPVTLRVRNETGTERGTDIDRIAALIREGPIADAGPDMTVCTNQRIRFDGSKSTDADGAVNAFAWTFGDGGTGSGENPVHIFKRPGEYSVTLTITGEARGECSPLDTDVAKILVVAAPEQVIIGEEAQAAGIAGEFSVQLAELAGAEVIGHRWSFSDGTEGDGLKRPLFAGDPEVRILGHGKDKERNTLSRGIARTSGADGLGSRERIHEQIGSTFVDLSEGWVQQRQPSYLGQATRGGYRQTRWRDLCRAGSHQRT